jgi:hypothetical protein
MSDQLTFPTIVPVPKDSQKLSIQERFELFHKLNPHIYHQLIAMARRLKAVGHKKIGIGMLWETLRWQHYTTTTDPNSCYALNDHYRSRYARLIQQGEIDLANIFEIRKLQTP